METVTQAIGHKIRVAMVDAGLTQAQLAEKAGVSLNTVSRQQRGLSPITVDQLARYAQVLKCEFVVAPATGFEPVTYRSKDRAVA
jgi:transcriptional regulator with XRE-family HTH domain